jgi:hypothetical protein
MARLKFDGVIEAVHYLPGGKIATVRAYERHGLVWSDHVLLERKELVERLERGKRFMTGERKEYLGNVFETSQKVRLSQGSVVTDGQAAERDNLAGVPIF